MENTYLYELRPSLITPTEKGYLTAIRKSLPRGYFVQPQINLASIIKRTDNAPFCNELFRNIDACIFDMTYKPIVLIEINDSSHNNSQRKKRDIKVKNICEEAGIQIITFWTSYGVNPDYISKKVNETIAKAPYVERICHSQNKIDYNTSNGYSVSQTPYTEQQTNYSQNQPVNNKSNGCYIATYVYGSYDCPNVWVLRRFRDNKLYKSFLGRLFIRLYYFVSPKLIKYFGEKRRFHMLCRKALDPIVYKLKLKGYSDKPYKDQKGGKNYE